MKTQADRAGFTLIELLVVIAIIGVLAGILLPAVTGLINRGKETAARTQMSSIMTAIKQYQAEYGKLPVPSADQGDPDKAYEDDDSMDILKVLMAEEDSGDKLNPRKIVFLELPSTVEAQAEGTFEDPYAEQYIIVLDTDYDGEITHPYASHVSDNDKKTFKTSVIVISKGEDTEEGSKDEDRDNLSTHEPNLD